jgi:hypothetical protein
MGALTIPRHHGFTGTLILFGGDFETSRNAGGLKLAVILDCRLG